MQSAAAEPIVLVGCGDMERVLLRGWLARGRSVADAVAKLLGEARAH